MAIYEKKFETPLFVSGEAVLFAAKSHLIDRFSPATEKILLPEYVLPRATIELKYDGRKSVSAPCAVSKKRRVFEKLKSFGNVTEIAGYILIDYRRNSPENWSHALNGHIPFAFFLKDELKEILHDRELLFILREKTPSYICNILDYFGIQYVKYDCDIAGTFLTYKQEPFDGLRSIAYKWVQEILSLKGSYRSLVADNTGLPAKVFLSRKDTRKIINEGEVETFLGKKGFTKFYAEDLKVQDQIRLFMHCDEIASVHGAAMGPIIYRPLTHSPLKLLEICTPGHMTNYFRGAASQIGAKWVGVRGRIEAAHVKEAYDFSKPFLKYSLADFFVDIDSVEKALDYLEDKSV